jgi:hypothetical protein
MQAPPPYKHMPEAWVINDRAPAQVRHILRDRDEYLGCGSFSIVIGVDEGHVLKVSTCEASQIILPRLMQQPRKGLPLVFKCFGQVGHVVESRYYDEIPIHAYLMERLHPVHTVQEKPLRTDACPRGTQMCAKTPADAVGAYNWLERKLFENAYGVEHASTEAAGIHPLVPAVHQALHGTRFSPLIGAVKKLAARVSAGEWTFDLVQRFEFNVMVSGWGEPILADPVYAQYQPMWKQAYPELYGGDSWT